MCTSHGSPQVICALGRVQGRDSQLLVKLRVHYTMGTRNQWQRHTTNTGWFHLPWLSPNVIVLWGDLVDLNTNFCYGRYSEHQHGRSEQGRGKLRHTERRQAFGVNMCHLRQRSCSANSPSCSPATLALSPAAHQSINSHEAADRYHQHPLRDISSDTSFVCSLRLNRCDFKGLSPLLISREVLLLWSAGLIVQQAAATVQKASRSRPVHAQPLEVMKQGLCVSGSDDSLARRRAFVLHRPVHL
jgi:hypothetical protein